MTMADTPQPSPDNPTDADKSLRDFLTPRGIRGRVRSAVRERAISNARVRILLSERQLEDFTEEELEIVVAEEERKLYSTVREKGLLAVLALLGINLFA